MDVSPPLLPLVKGPVFCSFSHLYIFLGILRYQTVQKSLHLCFSLSAKTLKLVLLILLEWKTRERAETSEVECY